MADIEPRRSGLSVLDGVLIVGGGIIAVVVVLTLISAVVGIVWFVIKVALAVALVAIAARFIFRKR
jgi:hypothetical protein